jgi:hypothetical protein
MHGRQVSIRILQHHGASAQVLHDEIRVLDGGQWVLCTAGGTKTLYVILALLSTFARLMLQPFRERERLALLCILGDTYSMKPRELCGLPRLNVGPGICLALVRMEDAGNALCVRAGRTNAPPQ